MKTLGIIGGLGPETTADFYNKVVFGFQGINTAHRASVVIASVPIPLDVERDLLNENKGTERYIPFW